MRILIVVDMQKDFVDQAMGTAEAVRIVPAVVEKINAYKENGDVVIATRDSGEIEGSLKQVYELFPRLEERKKQVAGTLSGGEQQMLAMGRALMSKPKLMMLDEPSMGLAPILVEQVFEIIRSLHKAGTTILLVEQNAQMALSVADRAYVLETGKLTMEGSADELLHSDAVRKAYLGS